MPMKPPIIKTPEYIVDAFIAEAELGTRAILNELGLDVFKYLEDLTTTISRAIITIHDLATELEALKIPEPEHDMRLAIAGYMRIEASKLYKAIGGKDDPP